MHGYETNMRLNEEAARTRAEDREAIVEVFQGGLSQVALTYRMPENVEVTDFADEITAAVDAVMKRHGARP